MRTLKLVVDEYYHIYNRGIGKQPIFHDDKDRARFLFLILYFQSPKTFINIGRQIAYFVKHRVFNISSNDVVEIQRHAFVEQIAFCLMPNHFHLIVKCSADNGISYYMQRVLNSYTKYYNERYKKSGHLFQGPYRAVHIENTEQLLHVSAYIHKNPIEIKEINKWQEYEWSSYTDFIGTNRWSLLKQEIILDQFTTQEAYKNFIATSTAKAIPELPV